MFGGNHGILDVVAEFRWPAVNLDARGAIMVRT